MRAASHSVVVMLSQLGRILSLAVTLVSSGCCICDNPFDEHYAAYGGRNPRADMVCGRVGSVFRDAGSTSLLRPLGPAGDHAEGEVLEPTAPFVEQPFQPQPSGEPSYDSLPYEEVPAEPTPADRQPADELPPLLEEPSTERMPPEIEASELPVPGTELTPPELNLEQPLPGPPEQPEPAEDGEPTPLVPETQQGPEAEEPEPEPSPSDLDL
jgi:hypothetical protein